MLNFDGGVEAVKLILKFQTFSVSDGTNLYNVCGECVELTQIGTKSSNTRKHVLQFRKVLIRIIGTKSSKPAKNW